MKILSEVEVEEETIVMIEMIEAEDLIEKEAMKKEEADQEAEVREPKQPSQVVGGASRTVANPKTSRPNKVKLTRDDIEMANRWGIPLERYAEQKLVADKAEGEYTTIITSKRGG